MPIVCLTAKIQFDNIGTYEYSSYSPCARSLCSIARLPPPHSEILDPPLVTPQMHEYKHANTRLTYKQRGR